MKTAIFCAAVLGSCSLGLAQYVPGMVWKRDTAWTPGTVVGQAWAAGNPLADSVGNRVWSMEIVEGGGLGQPDPWYGKVGTLMVWDNSWGATGNGCWVRSNDQQPNAFQLTMQCGSFPPPSQSVPLARWRNPAGNSTTFSAAGEFTVRSNISCSVDVVVAKVAAAGGATTLLHSYTVTLAAGTPDVRLVSIPPFMLAAGDQLVISARPTTEIVGSVTFTDDLAINLIGSTNCSADFNGDSSIDSNDITSFLNVWFQAIANNGCP